MTLSFLSQIVQFHIKVVFLKTYSEVSSQQFDIIFTITSRKVPLSAFCMKEKSPHKGSRLTDTKWRDPAGNLPKSSGTKRQKCFMVLETRGHYTLPLASVREEKSKSQNGYLTFLGKPVDAEIRRSGTASERTNPPAKATACACARQAPLRSSTSGLPVLPGAHRKVPLCHDSVPEGKTQVLYLP